GSPCPRGGGQPPEHQEARVVRGTAHRPHPYARASRGPPVAARSAHRRGSPSRRRQVLYERHHGHACPPRDAVPRSADVVQAQGGGPLTSVRLGDHGRLLVTDEAGGGAPGAAPPGQRGGEDGGAGRRGARPLRGHPPPPRPAAPPARPPPHGRGPPPPP